MLLVVHSSPHRNGNLERMVIRAAEATRQDYRLIRLADFTIAPCTGCVRCAHSKRCVQKDDMAPFYDELESADGLIMGGVNYNGRVNAAAHIFLERLYPLYHRNPAFRDKPAVVVAVGGEALKHNRKSRFRRFDDDPEIAMACEHLGATLHKAIG